ncbi:unnamed protein product [Calypogeia fissa]
MCRRGLRREPCNEGLLLLLLAGVLLLFSPFPQGSSSILPGCEARLLPLDGTESFSHGGTRGEEGPGEDHHSLRRILATHKKTAAPQAPSPSPSHSPSHSPSPSPSPKGEISGAPAKAPIAENGHSSTPKKSKRIPPLWALVVGPVVFLIIVAIVVTKVTLVRKRRRGKASGGTTWKKGLSLHDNQLLEQYTFASIPTITFEELEAACEEFTNVIGTSADCVIFKGTRLSDGVPIAVTRMRIPPERWTTKREIGFRHKVEDLARMNHDNMVNLVAYCATDSPFERILVFEYASNGTLYEHLHAKGMAEDHLDWATRMRIVMGAAFGLEYLHHKLVPPTSYFKFDARHVFLTEDYAAKLADFAVSADSGNIKTLGRRESFARIAQKVGYNEWETHKHPPNLDSNIRSFGVFLLEVVTGRRPFTDTQGPLFEWAKEYLGDKEKMWLMVDPSLKDYKKPELEAICEAVKMCLRPKGNKLPTMDELADMLSKALRMTREVANCKTSPLLWAEMELLNSMEHSLDDVPLGANSPKNYNNFSAFSPKSFSISSPDGRRGLFSPGGTANSKHKIFNRIGSGGNNSDEQSAIKHSPLPKLSASSLSLSSKRSWGASHAGELELLSPKEDEDDDDDESQEVPLAASINSGIASSQACQESFGRSFRRVWAENAAELAKFEGQTPSSNNLGR